MKKVSEFKSCNFRRERNSELVRRMRNGDSLSSFNSYSSWYPPRPVIEKDSHALQKLYGADVVPLTKEHGDQNLDLASFLQPLRLA